MPILRTKSYQMLARMQKRDRESAAPATEVEKAQAAALTGEVLFKAWIDEYSQKTGATETAAMDAAQRDPRVRAWWRDWKAGPENIRKAMASRTEQEQARSSQWQAPSQTPSAAPYTQLGDDVIEIIERRMAAVARFNAAVDVYVKAGTKRHAAENTVIRERPDLWAAMSA